MSEKFLNWLNAIVSLTIAVLTLFSGLLGWQIGNIAGAASEEYSRAQRAELNRQKIMSTNKLKAYEDYRAFLVYENYFSQYKLVSIQLEKAKQAEPVDEKLVAQLSAQQNDLESLYLSSLMLFPNQFINRDGTYNIQDELGQLSAAESRKLDTDPEKFQTRGEQYDDQVERMQIALITLALSLFFFAIISTVESLNKATFFVFLICGYLAAVAGLAMGISNWQPVLADAPVSSETSRQLSPTILSESIIQQAHTIIVLSTDPADTHPQKKLVLSSIATLMIKHQGEAFRSGGSSFSG